MSNGKSDLKQHEDEVCSMDKEIDDALAILPRYLHVYVGHYHDDFYIAKSFDPSLIAQLMVEGFLPIAGNSRFLLPKLHLERCVLQLRPVSNLHISKSTRKKSKRYLLSLNEAFDDVVHGCHRQHGINWLFPPIVNAFRTLHRYTEEHGACQTQLILDDSFEPSGTIAVRFYSVEIWNAETGKLAGGELGYTVGGMYSSLTGFTDEDAAGSVQLAALGKLLIQCGFKRWDLGMEMEYKRKLGAEMIPRQEFVAEVHRTRVEDMDLVLACNGRRNAKEIIDFDRPDLDIKTKGKKQRHGKKNMQTTKDEKQTRANDDRMKE